MLPEGLDVARLQGRQDRRDIPLALERRAGHLPDANAELVAHELDRSEIRALAARVDAVAEPLSRVTAVVLK